MGHRYHELAFTDEVKAIQEKRGSRRAYAQREAGDSTNDHIGDPEAAFIAARDSFYMATTSETGWPYVQHRGGSFGFVKVLDETTIALPEFAGNRQYVSHGNLAKDDRVSIIFMDYANRARLKLFGRARFVSFDEDPTLEDRLRLNEYKARYEGALLIAVEAFDWNCPQHITPRYTENEVRQLVAKLTARISELEAKL